MILAETQAKTKWCPMSRYILSDNVGLVSNRHGHVNDPWDSCLASDCMVWRWKTLPAGDIPGTTGTAHEGKGYCGLTWRDRP